MPKTMTGREREALQRLCEETCEKLKEILPEGTHFGLLLFDPRGEFSYGTNDAGQHHLRVLRQALAHVEEVFPDVE